MRLETLAAREVARLMVSQPTAEQIIAFHPSQEAADRAYALIDISRERPLSEDERLELDSFSVLENLMEMVKVEAHRQLQQRAS